MTAPIKFYYDLMSQPSRALYIFLKLSKIPTDFNPIALRTGKFSVKILFQANILKIQDYNISHSK